MDIVISNSFKKMTRKAIFAIILFVIVYLLLLSLAIGFVSLCIMGGIGLIIVKPMVITIGLGIGLAGLGVFILIFLFKFLFKKHKTDISHLTEITRSEEPKIFALIDEIIKEVKTDFPKKIYISSDVNACVFYDSSFWSMFLPIRKNLQIGLGLTNTISEQEFKAILSHEFGHFSQRSMKVGSYVYNVNQVIFNMLFDNESFDNMIQTWANISGYFSIFVYLGVKIINGIQWILGKMYGFVNLNYMALSREMEFHADEVAANIAGYLPLKESLLRLDLASHSLNSVLNFYEGKIPDNLKSKNIYKEQLFVMNFLAKDSNISFKNNLPLVSELDLSKYNKSRLNIKDQWASHPSTEERIAALEKLNILKENNKTTPAIALFSNPEKIEERITTQLFKNATYSGKATDLEIEKFQEEFTDIFNKNSFHKNYNGYYDNKNPTLFDIEKINIPDASHTLETLFSKEKVDMVYDHIALENDKNILNSIVNKEFEIKTFDYEGKKHVSKDAKMLVSKIENEIRIIKQAIEENDMNIYTFFYTQATKKGNESILKNKYESHFKEDAEFEKKNELFNRIVKSTNFISMVTGFEEIKTNLKTVSKIEVELKIEIKKILENDSLKEEITKSTKEQLEKYLSKNWSYFNTDEYNNDNLQVLFAAANNFNYLNARIYFLSKLHLLNYQIEQL